jgi:hypothetical protein
VHHRTSEATACTKAARRAGCTRTLQAALTDIYVDLVRPYEDTIPNPCTGVPVTLTGQNHILIHMTVDSNLGIHEVDEEIDFHATGVNLADGGTYSVYEQQWQSGNLNGTTSEFRADFPLRVTRQGETSPLPTPDDFIQIDHMHTTVSSSGVSVSEQFEPKCV